MNIQPEYAAGISQALLLAIFALIKTHPNPMELLAELESLFSQGEALSREDKMPQAFLLGFAVMREKIEGVAGIACKGEDSESS